VDLFSISAHKFYGPKGSGALLKKKSMHILPQITGGPQQTGFRAGTENVPFMVGLVKAYELKQAIIEEEFKRILSLRDKVVKEILARVPGSQLTGHPTQRLPNHASFVFSEVNGNELLMALDMAGFAVSSGSACKVGNPQPSEVLLALGIDKKLAMGSLRVTLGRMTTEEDVDKFINTLPIVIEKIRHG
jgi:cysteine desulfurase